jgi:hypothetical protein
VSIKSRLDRVEKSLQEPSAVGASESCICFPKQDYPLCFDRREHFARTVAVLCSEHGQRVWKESSFVMCNRSERDLAQDWDMNWPHHPEQYRKAIRASFERREQYVVPMPEIKL